MRHFLGQFTVSSL